MSQKISSFLNFSDKAIGFICVVIAGIGFGFLGIFGKLAFQNGLNVFELLSFRFIVASSLIGLILVIFFPLQLRLSRRQIVVSCLLGFFGYAVFSSFYFYAIQGLSVALAAMLLFTFPIFVNIGEIVFFSAKISQNKIISLILCTVGILLLLNGPATFNSSRSIFFALAAAVTYSVYVLVSGRLQKYTPAGGSSFFVILSAGIALSVFQFSQINFSKLLVSQNLFIILGIAVVCTIVPICFFLIGLQKIASGSASIIVTIEPVVASVAGFYILNESMMPLQIVGAGLILASLIVVRKE